MAKNLVVVESPSKIPSYKKVLGSEYEVMASYGHCIDLPEDELAVDIKNNFEPKFVVKSDHSDTVKHLCAAAKQCQRVYLMSDEDREGEAIAWHLSNEMKGKTSAQILRATTNEITAKGITKAINNPGTVDMNKIDAYLARRLLDRLCGYKTSYLIQKATGGRSAGRVQSAILRIIADREEEIKNFKPEEYWVLTAHLLSSKKEQFLAKLTDKIKVPNEKTATEIYNKVITGKPVVKSAEYKEVKSNPYPPFTTLPMIATASTVFGWGVEKTMDVAQDLYEAGHITYMRTDSPFMSDDAIKMCRQVIEDQFGTDYLPHSPRMYSPKKGAQEAHECCRPTNFATTPGLSGDEAKLYEMIWKRAVACQMIEGIDERAKIVTDIAGYEFVTHGSVIIFDGYRKVWTYSNSKDVTVPRLKEGEKCDLESLDKEQKFTTPPPRFSDASLAKKCEDEQISRPATFKNFVKTLKDRGYIVQKSKSFEATPLGIKVTKFLKESDVCFVDIKFTAGMENLLDSIQEKSKTKTEVLTEFWTRLQNDIQKGKDLYSKSQETDFVCPKCGGKLRQKHSKFGAFFSCENYKAAKKPSKAKTTKSKTKKKPEAEPTVAEKPGCSYIANVGADGNPVEKVKKEVEYAAFECKNCHSKMAKRSGKYGDFYGCSRFPNCRTVADLNGVFKEKKSKYFKKKKD